MNGVIIFHPAYKEKWYGHYCFFGHWSNYITHFWEVVKKKLKGLNIWPFTGITSTIAYSTESTEVALARMNFLLWDANCGLIASLNPICLGQSSKTWVSATLFYRSVPNFLSQGGRNRRKFEERSSNIQDVRTVRNKDWSRSKWVLLCEEVAVRQESPPDCGRIPKPPKNWDSGDANQPCVILQNKEVNAHLFLG